MSDAFKGGDKLLARLEQISARVAKGSVKVGFLAGSTYPDGTSLPMVAAVNEFGGTIKVPEHKVEIYRKISKSGEFLNDGKFVSRAKSNFATTHDVGAHTITIPARPFMRPCIASKKHEWGENLATLLVASNYDAATALQTVGEVMAADIVETIQSVTTPENAPSTIAKKGSDKPLEHTDFMLNSVGIEVT